MASKAMLPTEAIARLNNIKKGFEQSKALLGKSTMKGSYIADAIYESMCGDILAIDMAIATIEAAQMGCGIAKEVTS